MRNNLKPLIRSTALRDQVYERMRESIRGGRIRAGERLQEITLAEALGVSRTPVREALAMLASDGLAEQVGRGFVVAGLSPQDIDEIFELRRLLEPTAVRAAALALKKGTADASGLEAVQAAVKKSRRAHEAGDVEGFMAANAEFRAAWLALVPNTRLVRAVRLYDDHVESLRVMTLSEARVRTIALDGLAELATALAAKDGAKAAAAMATHLDKAEAALRQAAAETRRAS